MINKEFKILPHAHGTVLLPIYICISLEGRDSH